MSQNPQNFAAHHQLFSLVHAFWQWRMLWIGCTIAFTLIGLLYAILLKSDTWVASQGLVIRDETSATLMRLGRFESQTQMKVAQELVSDIARNPKVVGEALGSVGRESSFFGFVKNDRPFSASEIEGFARDNVSIRAPRGAELGTTELIYLEVKDQAKERSIQLTSALCDALEEQLQSVRQTKAEGIIRELEAAKSVSERELASTTENLKRIEIEAGADLADLRGLTDAHSGSTNRLMLDMVRDEYRKSEIELQIHHENLEATRAALTNDDLLIQVTDRLVDTQPTIKKLREGLADAALKTAELQARYTDKHPKVIVAQTTEQQFRVKLRKELSNSAQAILGAIDLCKTKLNKLNQQEQELGKRLSRLADIRANYTNVVAEMKARSDELHLINRDLTQAIAARDAASVASLVTRVNEPVLGDKPVGPGRSTIVGGSLVGGLFLGLGIAFMLIPLDTNMGGSPQSKREGSGFVPPAREASSQSRAEGEARTNRSAGWSEESGVANGLGQFAGAWLNHFRNKAMGKSSLSDRNVSHSDGNRSTADSNSKKAAAEGTSRRSGALTGEPPPRPPRSQSSHATPTSDGQPQSETSHRKPESMFDPALANNLEENSPAQPASPKGLDEVRSIIAEALNLKS